MTATGISIAFDDNIFTDSPTYVAIDDHVIEWTARLSGRASEFDQTEGGSATIKLQDRAGDFDPLNATGSHYGSLLPMRQAKINVKHPLRATYHDVWSGYTDTFGYHRLGPRGAETSLSLVDGFEVLNQCSVVPGSVGGTSGGSSATGSFYAAQHVDDRLKAALLDAGWLSSRWRIATGNVNCQPITYDAETPILQVCQEGAGAEFPGIGNFFMDKSGNAAFSGRFIRFHPDDYPDWVKTWRVGDDPSYQLDPTLLPMVDFTSSFGKSTLYNDIVCAPRGAEAETIAASHVQHPVSIAQFGKRSLALLDLLVLDGATSGLSGIDECKTIAGYYRDNYHQVLPRIDSIEFHGQMDDGSSPLAGALWDFILGVEVNHLIEMHIINPGGGGMTGVNFFVEGITHAVSRLNGKIPRWTMTLDLSPRALYTTEP